MATSLKKYFQTNVKQSLVLSLLLILLVSFSQKKELKWMAIGDSITYLNDKPELTRNRITKGYMSRVVDELPYIHFANHSFGGLTAKNIADNINNLGLEKADFYSVFLGTNDWWTSLPIGTFADYQNDTGNQTAYGSYRTIVNKIRSLNSDAVIIFITPFQRTDYVDINNSASIIYGSYKAKNGHFLSEYADVMKTIAKAENFKLVDLYYKSGVTPKNAVKYRRLRDPKTGGYKNYKYPEYIGMPFNPATDDYPYPVDAMNYTYDGLHPTDKGHALIAKMLVKLMKKY
ncbi:SGNH/GDSL hydrolase family protein [Mucilaginibacter sp. UR6-11]|uniref:SGNH/GDSL hydrolase family protein n=1 Tax=Mucilaginibacter sp. UR6-11 TaxID=1435644 RepID=UPI001E3044DB|nr:SGNH/GDSL hydrolase family protein [Mucilaginibacter sp. UR6-11]MCC8424643.1 SGNH/GDSL hydrolase family protein [Mucilaginibacter sp. UR6-11]